MPMRRRSEPSESTPPSQDAVGPIAGGRRAAARLAGAGLVALGLLVSMSAHAGPGSRLDPSERARLRGELREQPWHQHRAMPGPPGGGWSGPPAWAPQGPAHGHRPGGRDGGPPGYQPAPSWMPQDGGPPPSRMSPDERRELRRQLREGERYRR